MNRMGTFHLESQHSNESTSKKGGKPNNSSQRSSSDSSSQGMNSTSFIIMHNEASETGSKN